MHGMSLRATKSPDKGESANESSDHGALRAPLATTLIRLRNPAYYSTPLFAPFAGYLATGPPSSSVRPART